MCQHKKVKVISGGMKGNAILIDCKIQMCPLVTLPTLSMPYLNQAVLVLGPETDAVLVKLVLLL